MFQIRNLVVNNFDLLLQHRHAPGEVVVFPHLAGQLLQLGVGDGLLLFQLGLHLPVGLVAGDDHPQQRQTASDERHDYGFRHDCSLSNPAM